MAIFFFASERERPNKQWAGCRRFPLPRPTRFARAQLIFPSPFPFLAPATQASNATISVTHTVIMEEFDEDVLENEEIIANVKRFLRDGCGCSLGVKGGPCCQQFSEKLVLSNVNNCLELTRAELDLVILANIQAVAKSDLIKIYVMYVNNRKRVVRWRC